MESQSTKLLKSGTYDLKIGSSFSSGGSRSKYSKSDAYHTLRYDFKPASVENAFSNFMEMSDNGEVTILIPKSDNPTTPKDVNMFKGSKKAYQKDCLLIFDHERNTVRLEMLTGNIQVKKTRDEVTSDHLNVVHSYLGKPEVGSPETEIESANNTDNTTVLETNAHDEIAATFEAEAGLISDFSDEEDDDDDELSSSNEEPSVPVQPSKKEPPVASSVRVNKAVLDADLRLSESDSD